MESEDDDYEPKLHEAPSKRSKTETAKCIICGSQVPLPTLTKPKDIESWHSLLEAAKIRNFTPILQYSTVTDEIPHNITYERKCRNDFTHKKYLERLQASGSSSASEHPTDIRRSHRQPDSTKSTVYCEICIFCNKSSKYLKGSRTREKLIQCVDMRADGTLRGVATARVVHERAEEEKRMDERVLAITSRDIVAAEAHYHKSCYIKYTKIKKEVQQAPGSDIEYDREFEIYSTVETVAYNQLFEYIRADIFGHPRVIQMTEITEKLVYFMHQLGVTEVKAHTKKHIRRKLETEFASSLQIISTRKGKLLVMPYTLSKEQLAEDYMNMKENCDILTRKDEDFEKQMLQVAVHLRKEMRECKHEQAWPPCPEELDESYVNIPKTLTTFLTALLTGDMKCEQGTSRVQRLVWSYSQDLIYGATNGQIQTSKHILLPWAVKTLTGNVEIIKFINRLGHGVSYSKLEEVDTSLCLQKLQMHEDKHIGLPSNIYPSVPTVLAYDNIDRREETLSGSGTSHRVNGIIVQPQVSATQLPSTRPEMEKNKKRSIPSQTLDLPQYDCGERRNPPPVSPLPPTDIEKTEASQAKYKNFIWFLMRQSNQADQKVSSWTGFNIQTNDSKEVTKDTIGYLPTINAPATQMSTVNHILQQTKMIMTALNLDEVVCVFDQALYAKAAELVWKNQEHFKNIVLRMGAFHTICNLLSIIGKRFGDAGLRHIAVETGLIAEGSISSVLEGRQYNRGVRLHKIMYEAFLRLSWSGFCTWLKENHSTHVPKLVEVLDKISECSQKPNHESFMALLEDESCKQILIMIEEYHTLLQEGNSQLLSFWMSYVHMVEILLALIRASREGNWHLHLHAVSLLIPWCFAYDKINYARYLSVYYAQMTRLPLDHPTVHCQLSRGAFSVQLSESNTFGRIPVDQTVEETVNKDTQTAGGTKGFSLKQTAVSRYYLTAEYRSLCLRQLRTVINLEEVKGGHPDLTKTRIKKDESHVQAVFELLEDKWINPFDPSYRDLLSISSGIAAPQEVSTDLLEAEDKGKAAYQRFVETKLATGHGFFERITKLNLKTFSNVQAKKKTKSANTVTILKADHHLFSRMLLIAGSRCMDMEKVLKYPLGPLPWSMANCDGSMRKTNKAALARHLEKQASSEENVTLPSATIIDAMSLVQKLEGDNRTFEELSDQLFNRALQSNPISKRVDVVFDIYKEPSIKQAERVHRGSEHGISFSKIVATHRIRNWRQLLSCSKSKERLTYFFAESWKGKQKQLGEKVLYVTYGKKCLRISSDAIEEVQSLETMQEEADTRLLLHIQHAASSGSKSVIVIAEDTDVMILCLAFVDRISCEVFMRSGTKNRTILKSINKIASAVGKEICSALPGLHAYTGCDTVSSFAGQGKLKGLKLVCQSKAFQKAFSELGNKWDLPEDLFAMLQEFTCRLYAARSPICHVNELRYQIWRAKKGAVVSGQLPPCEDSLRQHCLRANYQTAIWRRSLVQDPDVPAPQNIHGWTLGEDGQLEIQWMTGSPAPSVILEFISCRCIRSCQLPGCECMASGLKCTNECRLQDCTNMTDENDKADGHVQEETYADQETSDDESSDEDDY